MTASHAKPIPPLPSEVQARFWSKVERGAPEQCWPWRGYTTRGYGRLTLPGLKGSWPAHRLAYAIERDAPPADMVIDHICRNRSCCNPAHLRIVSNTENVLCGVGHTARNAVKTHCPEGHEYTEANTRHYRGKRYCRACNKRWKKARDQRVKRIRIRR